MSNILNERLKKARKSLGLSQEFVANKMGAHRTTITAIELGTRKVNAEELDFFSILYGLSVDYLMYGDTEEKDVRMFARAYSSLSEIDRREIMNLIDFKKRVKENRA